MQQQTIPEQKHVSWAVTLNVSWAGIKRRFFRSLITMSGVVLAIAFLTYMQVMNEIVQALVEARDPVLDAILQAAGVEIHEESSNDSIVLLIILSLLACFVGIVNSMLMSVTERIKEIGTLKCLGALDGFIVRSYFIESSVQGVAGTCLGCILGLIVSIVVAFSSYKGHVATHFPWVGVFNALLVSLLIGTLLSVSAAILPAYMAAKKQPVDAMRVEE
ncbi:MAG: FtsX-like permease family protein [Lentisphaerae bacterium]|jgi:putative ABC transport system permease protein|nr:FtsX-like permease family protein [Lentisphaerota bacterium]